MQDEPPVAEFVAEALEHQGPVVGQVASCLALARQVGEQVRRSQPVEPGAAQPGCRLLRVGGTELAAVLADRPAEFRGPARRVTMPERQLSWLPGRWRDDDLVGRDVLDPPRARAEHEHVTDPRLVDHLFVELADPARMPAALVRRASQEHAEQAAVRDRAAAGDSQPGPQASELLARIAAGQHVKHGLEHGPAQAAERGGPPDQGVHIVDAPVVHRCHRDDMLGQHVERVARHPQLFDLAGPHPACDHRCLYEIALVLREDHPTGDIPDIVPGATGPL